MSDHPQIPHPISDVADWGDIVVNAPPVKLISEITDPGERRAAEEADARVRERLAQFPTAEP